MSMHRVLTSRLDIGGPILLLCHLLPPLSLQIYFYKSQKKETRKSRAKKRLRRKKTHRWNHHLQRSPSWTKYVSSLLQQLRRSLPTVLRHHNTSMVLHLILRHPVLLFYIFGCYIADCVQKKYLILQKGLLLHRLHVFYLMKVLKN